MAQVERIRRNCDGLLKELGYTQSPWAALFGKLGPDADFKRTVGLTVKDPDCTVAQQNAARRLLEEFMRMIHAEPLDGPIETGMSLWWAPHDPKAFEVVKVSGVLERDGVTYVQTESVRTGERFWNRESRVRDLLQAGTETRARWRSRRRSHDETKLGSGARIGQ